VRYEYLDGVQRLLAEYGAEVLEQNYTEEAKLRFQIEEARFSELSQRVSDVSRGTIALTRDDS